MTSAPGEQDKSLYELLEGLGLMAVVLDADGRTTYCNPHYLRVTGFAPEEIVGHDWFSKSLPAERVEPKRTRYRQLVAGDSLPPVVETELVTRDGRRRTIRWGYSMLRASQGEPRGICSIGEDVTDLRENQRHLTVALEAARGATFEWSVDTGAVRLNDRCFTLLGYPPGAFPDTLAACMALLHPDERDTVLGFLAVDLENGSDLFEYEARLLAADGRWRWFLFRSRCAARRRDGRPNRLIGVVIDIDQRKRAEAARARLAELYALRAAVNQAIARTPERAQLLARVGEIVVEHGGFREAACVMGPTIPPRTRGFPLRREGEVVGALCVLPPSPDFFEPDRVRALEDVAQDVSFALDTFARDERRGAAEAALHESQTRLQVALSATGQGTFDYNLATGEGSASRECPTMLGYDADQFPSGSLQTFMERLHPDDRQVIQRRMAGLATGDVSDYRDAVRVRSATGEWRWLELVGAVAERDEQGNSRRVVGTFADITERKRSEAAQLQLQAQLAQAQKIEAVGRLAGGMVHDFNNLLSVVLSYSRLILGDLPEGHSLRDDVGEILKAGERGAALTRQLLAFTRQRVVKPRVFDLNEVVTGVERMIRRVVGEDVDVSLQLANQLLSIDADPGQMEQVLMNLIVNARDAMPEGGKLVLATTRGPHPQLGGKYVILSVADTGAGMSEATRARLFEPFFTTKERGTGLGLATVFGIVRQASGWISVDSDLGKGTTFRIYLPAAERAPAAAQKRTSPTGELGTETVLLVEDEESVRVLTRTLLVKLGYLVLEAPNGAEALAVAERHTGEIHLLLTDVVMPGMSGLELVRRMMVLRPGTKVLCMSGYTGQEVLQQGVLGTEIPFLQKPITPETLAVKVREVLDGR